MLDVRFKYVFNDNAIRSITTTVGKLDATRVRVGVLGGDGLRIHPTSKLPVWQVAALQEFGSQDGHIPERSFIRRTLNNLTYVRTVLANATGQVVNGKKTANDALSWVGQVLVNAIQQTILSNVSPANAPATVAWKGHGDTLMGKTDTMYNAVSSDVVSGAGIAKAIRFTPGE